MEKEILQALKEDTLYDFITNNYYRMPQEISRDLLLEIYYILRVEKTEETKESINLLNETITEYLQENRDWEE